jgi:hypothetical protein
MVVLPGRLARGILSLRPSRRKPTLSVSRDERAWFIPVFMAATV